MPAMEIVDGLPIPSVSHGQTNVIEIILQAEPIRLWLVLMENADCLLGVHDGPKVANPGDRIASGTGVSRRQGCRSTTSDSFAGTDGRCEMHLLAKLRR